MGNPNIEEFENLTPDTGTRLLVFDDTDYGKEKYISGSDILTAAGVTATATELNLLGNADRATKVVKVALTASTGAGGVLTWRNTEESADIIVTRFVLNVTTEATGAANVDVGQSATVASSDNLLDGQDIGSAAAIFDNIDDQGTNGQSVVIVADDEYITATASADPAGLVGFAYIFYHVI